jgi:hypothetical protein
MSVMDSGQPRPDTNDPSTDDRKNTTDRPKRRRKSNPDHYAKWGKADYEKNKAAYIARAAETKRKCREEWAAYKATLSCVRCGENHPATLDFHHAIRLPNNRKVHKLAGAGMLKAAMEEIKKCIVLCANCHRKHHYEEDQMKRGPKPPPINQKG